jgi:hypothetical protein
MIMGLRCCAGIADEFKPSYASILVHGPEPSTLREAVRTLEESSPITSCFTGWCSHCASPSLITTDLESFMAPSAHHTHQLLLLSVLQKSGAFFTPGEA